MPEATPIRDGVSPRFDTEHELVDFAATRVRTFVNETGKPPQAIAVVLIGANGKGETHTIASTWSPDDSKGRLEICAAAAMLLTQRALKE